MSGLEQFLLGYLDWMFQSGLAALTGMVGGLAAIILPILLMCWFVGRLRYLVGFALTFRVFPYTPGPEALECLRKKINEILYTRAKTLSQTQTDLKSAEGYWETVRRSLVARQAKRRFQRSLELARLFRRMEVLFSMAWEYEERKFEKVKT